MKKMIMLVITGVFTLTALGCNTMEGLGEDIQKGGEAIEKAATK